MPARILLTGGTGFLGSHLAARLLADGHEVTLLARPAADTSAAERVRRLMDWHDVGADARRRLRVVTGDLTANELGLAPTERAWLCQDIDEIVHCAAETSFAERKRDLVERVNLGGLAGILGLAAKLRRLVAFHHVSTAYAVGRRDGICREEWPTGAEEFNNPYEETKCRGELMVRAQCADLGVRSVVYRPAIVYGDSRTGRSLEFKAIYQPVKAIVMLRDTYLEDLRAREGEKARAAGVRLTPEGKLWMPLRVETEGIGLYLLPVDFFIDAFAAIRAAAGSEGIYHLVGERPTAIADVLAYLARMFEVRGIATATRTEIAATPGNCLETTFNHMIAGYRPYLADRRRFATDRAGPLLAQAGVSCPAFSYDAFARCMAYAVATAWGRRPS